MRLALALLSITTLALAATPPVKYLTRAEAVTLLLRQSRPVFPEIPANPRYADVLDNQWYTSPMMYALRIGMLDSDPSHSLLFPHKSISRAEFLKMLTIAFSLETNFEHVYSDVKKNSWIEPYAGVAYFYHLFEDPTRPTLLEPHRRVTHTDAIETLEAIFRAEERLAPRHSQTILGTKFQTAKKAVSPSMVKNSFRKLFKIRGGIDPDETRYEVVSLINDIRRQYGLNPLRVNPRLQLAADRHAEDMHKRGYFSHTTPEGLDYVDRIRNAHYLAISEADCGCTTVFNVRSLIEKSRSDGSPSSVTSSVELCDCRPNFSLGENIAKGQLTSREVVQDWMNSPSHRKNILHPDFDEIGIGLFGTYWVQNFGRMDIQR